MSLNRDLIRTGLTSVLVAFATMVSGVIVARLLGPADRGVYGAMVTTSQILTFLITAPYFDAFSQQLSKDGSRVSLVAARIILTASGIFAFVLGISFLLRDLIGNYIGVENDTPLLLAIIGMPIMWFAHQATIGVDRAMLNFDSVNQMRGRPALLFLCLCPLVLLAESNFIILICLALIGSRLLVSLPKLVRIFSQSRLQTDRQEQKITPTLGTFCKFFPGHTMNLAGNQIDKMVGIYFWPAATLGNYFVAFSAIGFFTSILTQAINTVVLPTVSSLNTEKRAKTVEYLLRLSLISSVLVLAGSWIVLPKLIPLVYGDGFGAAGKFAKGLSLALCLTPIKAVIFESVRTLGEGRPAFEMSAATALIVLVGAITLGYENLNTFFIFFAGGQLLAILWGGFYLARRDILTSISNLIPKPSDVTGLLKSAI